MKVEKLLELIGDIDDSFVEEATLGKKRISKMPWSLMATAACLCLVIASLVVLRSMGLLPVAPMPTDPTQTTTQPSETTMPTETTQPTEIPTPDVIPDVEDLLSEKGSWLNIALTMNFSDISQVDPARIFVRSYDGKQVELSKLEQEGLKELLESSESAKIARFTAEQINEVLFACFGLTADQMGQDFWNNFTYLEETDCYYKRYWGTGGTWISVVDTQECEDGTILVYYAESSDAYAAPNRVARLRSHHTGYCILSNEYYTDNAGKTQEQIAMEALFGGTQSWYNRALACEYETPEQLSLIHVFYSGFPDESWTPTPEEWEQLKGKQGFNENYDLMRLPESKMDQVLRDYFGITLDDIPDEGFSGLTYLESTDCWYFMTTGWLGVERFHTLTVEEHEDGTIRVCYDSGSDIYVTVLRPNGEGYHILSNQKAPATPAEQLEIYQDLFADPESWFSRALTGRYYSRNRMPLSIFFSTGAADESQEVSQAERSALEQTGKLDMGTDRQLCKLPATRMNEVLEMCFGMTLADMDAVSFMDMVYLEDTDCWYFLREETDAVVFTARSAVEMDNGLIRIRYTAGKTQAEYVVTLQPYDGGYYILSNQDVYAR